MCAKGAKTVNWEIFVVKKFLPITFNDEKIEQVYFVEWSYDENKTARKFTWQNILPVKNSRSTGV